MVTTVNFNARQIDSPAMRSAGRDALSLALLDARNHTLDLMAQFGDTLGAVPPDMVPLPHLASPLWLAGRAGWFQERWVGRNPQRALGPLCDPTAVRLGATEPLADAWWEVDTVSAFEIDDLALPPAERVRAFLLDGLESTLALLEKTPDTDQALYFFRLALFHEDACGEAMVQAAQAFGVPLKLPLPVALGTREPLRMPATRWTLGMAPDASARAVLVPAGFTFDNETMAHEVAIPEFEIDAQPVSWAQFVEFVDDGGYDDPSHWRPEGWAWLQQAVLEEGRRAPRYVEQIGVASGAVMQTRFGQAMRLAGHQPVVHLTWWEADAWCRWAGRRLPTEVEWEAAAHTAAGRGFRWGDVWEWTAGHLQPYPGFSAGPWHGYSVPWFGQARVLRGASFATRQRMKHPKFRGFALPDDDTRFVGFRSCAV